MQYKLRFRLNKVYSFQYIWTNLNFEFIFIYKNDKGCEYERFMKFESLTLTYCSEFKFDH